MSIASNVIEENTRLATCMTLMQEKLDLNNKSWDSGDDLRTLIEKYRCYYVDLCNRDKLSLYDSTFYVKATYNSGGYYNLKQNGGYCFGHLTLKDFYFPDECVIEVECNLVSSKSLNNQLRVGLYDPNNGNNGVICNIYSDNTIEIRFGTATESYNESWTEIVATAEKELSIGVWYKLRFIITKSTLSLELFDASGTSMGSIGYVMRSGILGDANKLYFGKCYTGGTEIKIRNIKVYSTGYLE